MYRLTVCLLCLGLCFRTSIEAQPAIPSSDRTSAAVMKDFMAQRFGMFIHFGSVTQRGTEIGWSRNKEVPQSDYDSLYHSFNPVLFDADQWVRTAKAAGMKYLTITAKHHDGFCLWPTRYSDYSIARTPFKKDIIGALADACKKAGIHFCIYMTVLDWHDPHYPIHNPHKPVYDSAADMQQFVATMKAELKELVTTYHPYMLWFDGNWETPWKQSCAEDMYRYLKKLDPDVIINNRLGKGDHNKLSDSTVGDFATPEQEIGALNMKDPWETCMTICTQWAWKPNDEMKSLRTCIQTLARTAGGNGNLLFNVGPMMDGRIEPRQVKRLREIGSWLTQYGESIYGTGGGPFPPGKTMACTRKGRRIYLHIFGGAQTTLKLPALAGARILKCHWLHQRESNLTVPFRQNKAGIQIDLPGQLPDSNDAVLVLEIDRDAASLPVISSLNNIL